MKSTCYEYEVGEVTIITYSMIQVRNQVNFLLLPPLFVRPSIISGWDAIFMAPNHMSSRFWNTLYMKFTCYEYEVGEVPQT